MALEINGKTIEGVWDSCLDIAAFAAVGYLAGRAVNWFIQWSSTPSFFTKATQIDLKSAVVCCALFAIIDRFAHAIFSAIAGSGEVNKPVYSVFRIGASAAGAISLLNAFALPGKLAGVETQLAGAVILTAIAIYSQILLYLSAFNNRHIDIKDYNDLNI